MRKTLWGLVMVMVFVTLVGCGSDNNANTEEAEKQPAPELPEISEDELVDNDEVVATVNEDDILGNQYNFIYAQLKTQYMQMQQDTEKDELQELTLDKVIEEELLAQTAEAEGIKVSEEEAEEQLEQLKQEAEDNLNTILEQFQMSEEEFKNRLQFELTMEKFQAEQIEVDVTDDEVEKTYEDIKAENEDVPELSEVKDQIKAQLYNEKVNEELGKIIDKAKKNAKIERKLKT